MRRKFYVPLTSMPLCWERGFRDNLAMELGIGADGRLPELSGAAGLDFKAVLELAFEAVLVVSAEGKLIYANRRVGEITGYRAPELIGKSYRALVFLPEAELNQIEELLVVGLTGRLPHPHEFVLGRKDGRIQRVTLGIVPLQQEGKRLVVLFLQATSGDKAEMLAEGGKFAASLLDNAPEPILAIAPDGSIHYVNRAFEKLTGFSAAEVVGKKPPYPWWPPAHERELSRQEKIIAGGKSEREYLFRGKDGRQFWVEVRTSPLAEGGATGYFVEAWADITGRKVAAEALRGSEEKFRSLFVHAREAVLLTDAQTGTIVDINPAGCRLLGMRKDEIIGMRHTQVYPPELAEEYRRLFEGHLEKGIVASDVITIQRANGTLLEVEVSASVIRLGNSRLVQWVMRNVTERRQMERALRESEARFAAAFRASPCGISITTLKDGVFLDVNESFLRQTGYTREEIIGHSSRELKIWAKPEDRERILHALRQSGRVVNEQYVCRTKDGRIRTMLLSAEPVDIAGEPCIIAVTTDITGHGEAAPVSREDKKPEAPESDLEREITKAYQRLSRELEERNKAQRRWREARMEMELARRART